MSVSDEFFFRNTCVHKIRNLCFYTAWPFRNRKIDSIVIACYKHWQSYYGIQKRKNYICSSDPKDCSLASSSSKMLSPKRNWFSMIREKTSSYNVYQFCCKLKNLVGKWKSQNWPHRQNRKYYRFDYYQRIVRLWRSYTRRCVIVNKDLHHLVYMYVTNV